MSPSLEEALQASSCPSVQVEDLHWTKLFFLAEDFPGFLGHFPGHPILPAMTQITIARLFFQEVCGSVDALNVISAKYMHPIYPRQQLIAHLCIGKPHKITVEIHVTEGEKSFIASSMQLKPVIFG